MKKETIQPRIGKDGKYLSIFIMEKWFLESSDKPEDIQEGLKEMAERTAFVPEEVIAECQKFFIQVIEDHGIEIKKPYNFRDFYQLNNNSEGDITFLVKQDLGMEAWELEHLGMAAKILERCYILRGAIDEKNISQIVRWAMLLQVTIDRYNFKQWELPARVGIGRILSGKDVGLSNLGKETPFTQYIRYLIDITAQESEGEFTTDEVINNLEYHKKMEEIEISDISYDNVTYWEGENFKTITMRKLREKISALKYK